jgi:hypothetical protein
MIANAEPGRAGDFASSRKGGLTADERAFAWEKRCKGTPTAAIAQMLQRPSATLEALFSGKLTSHEPEELPAPQPSNPLAGLPRAVREIIVAVARRYAVTPADILGPSSSRREAHPRQACYWTIYQLRTPLGERRYSTPQIARLLNRTDHTTVLAGIKAHTKRLAAAGLVENVAGSSPSKPQISPVSQCEPSANNEKFAA